MAHHSAELMNRSKQLPTGGGVVVGFLLLALCSALLALPVAAATGAEPRLDDFFRLWREAATPWLQPAEAELFDRLATDVDRELFLHSFWQQRDPHPEDAGNAPAERFQRHLEEALVRYEGLDDARAMALLVAGKPRDVTHFGACADVLRPLETWAYGDGTHLVFYRRGSEVVHWTASDGVGALMFGDGSQWTSQQVYDFFDQRGCWKTRHGASVDFAAALEGAPSYDTLARRSVVAPRDPQWTTSFTVSGDAALSSDAAGLPIPIVRLSTPGRYQQKTILEGRFEVPVDWVGRNLEGHLFDRFVILGDIWFGERAPGSRGGRLVDSFQVAHYVAGSSIGKATFPLAVYRRLRPGKYSVDLRLQDRRGLALARHQAVVEVPRLDVEASSPAGYAKGFAGLTRSDVGVLTTFPGVEILSPGPGLLVGEVWIETVTTGGPIERVDFLLDGTLAASDREFPYAAQLDFGPEPADHQLVAVAYDPAGRELQRDALVLEVVSSRLAVHLVEPVRGRAAQRARAIVELPPDAVLDRVEFFLGKERFALLEEAPFKHPLPPRPPRRGEPLYVRVLATLENGDQAEDLVLIDARTPFDAIDVQRVELYTAVHDSVGRPVTGLPAEAFTVRDDGAVQSVLRFDTVDNLAINVALLMDISSSMRRRLELASRSARQFFETVLRPKDQASLLVFNDDIRQIVPFTDQASRLLDETVGFRAWGTTRLHDSLIYTVHSFAGLEGKRALVLLSDGQDVDSDFPFRQVLEATRKARIAVYPIVLGLEDSQTLEDLRTLAEATGGRFFSISSIEQLDRVYRRIEEELRSQYLLVYAPPPPSVRGELRQVRVEVAGEGLSARTLSGYYP